MNLVYRFLFRYKIEILTWLKILWLFITLLVTSDMKLAIIFLVVSFLFLLFYFKLGLKKKTLAYDVLGLVFIALFWLCTELIKYKYILNIIFCICSILIIVFDTSLTYTSCKQEESSKNDNR